MKCIFQYLYLYFLHFFFLIVVILPEAMLIDMFGDIEFIHEVKSFLNEFFPNQILFNIVLLMLFVGVSAVFIVRAIATIRALLKTLSTPFFSDLWVKISHKAYGREEVSPGSVRHLSLKKGGSIHTVYVGDHLVGTIEGDPIYFLSERIKPKIGVYQVTLGPIKDIIFTRTIILDQFSLLFPGASLLVTKQRVKGGLIQYHVGIKIPDSPRMRVLLSKIRRAFPQLQNNELLLSKHIRWILLCNRLIREDREYLVTND